MLISFLRVFHGVFIFQAKKPAQRRNPWGPESYSELIIRAISNSPNQRLTLSQIYDWVAENISYFADKRDHNSSKGWKVSSDVIMYLILRHNTEDGHNLYLITF